MIFINVLRCCLIFCCLVLYTDQTNQLHPDCEQPMHERFLPTTEDEWRLHAKCNRSIPMYSFNVTSGNCEDSVALGCPANANSFNNYYTCMSFCRLPQNPDDVCSQPPALSTTCDNFEAHYYKFYYDGKSCMPFNANECQFNGNHFHTVAQCETMCGRAAEQRRAQHAMLQTQSPNSVAAAIPLRSEDCYTRVEFRIDGDCRARPTLRNDRWPLQVNGQEALNTMPEPNTPAPFFIYDAKQQRCRAQHLHECVTNGNRFETLDECLLICAPRGFECPFCDAHKYRRWKATCELSRQSKHTYECSMRTRTFNWTALREEVATLERLLGDGVNPQRSLIWLANSLIMITLFTQWRSQNL